MSECFVKKELKKQVVDYYCGRKPEDGFEYSDRKIPNIDDFPTIDAIPVSWIKEYVIALLRLRDECEVGFSDYNFYSLIAKEIERMVRVRKEFEVDEENDKN